MTNEEFQSIVLKELKDLNSKVGTLEEGQKNLATGQKQLIQRVGTLETGQKQLIQRVGTLETGQRNLEAGQQQLTEKVGSLEVGQREIRKELGFVWGDIKKIDNRLERQEMRIDKVVP